MNTRVYLAISNGEDGRAPDHIEFASFNKHERDTFIEDKGVWAGMYKKKYMHPNGKISKHNPLFIDEK